MYQSIKLIINKFVLKWTAAVLLLKTVRICTNSVTSEFQRLMSNEQVHVYQVKQSMQMHNACEHTKQLSDITSTAVPVMPKQVRFMILLVSRTKVLYLKKHDDAYMYLNSRQVLFRFRTFKINFFQTTKEIEKFPKEETEKHVNEGIEIIIYRLELYQLYLKLYLKGCEHFFIEVNAAIWILLHFKLVIAYKVISYKCFIFFYHTLTERWICTA